MNFWASLSRWSRPLTILTVILFFISLLFPISAALTKDTAVFSSWIGTLDVALAFVLTILAFTVVGIQQHNITPEIEQKTYRAYRGLIHIILLLLILFFVLGNQIMWINGLTGIGWRLWLLLYCLPYWFSSFSARAINMR